MSHNSVVMAPLNRLALETRLEGMARLLEPTRCWGWAQDMVGRRTGAGMEVGMVMGMAMGMVWGAGLELMPPLTFPSSLMPCIKPASWK